MRWAPGAVDQDDSAVEQTIRGAHRARSAAFAAGDAVRP
jgi:hypothetical protein